ncbi:unnamed protein product [Ectocarpus sp. 13 AM-2016]
MSTTPLSRSAILYLSPLPNHSFRSFSPPPQFPPPPPTPSLFGRTPIRITAKRASTRRARRMSFIR